MSDDLIRMAREAGFEVNFDIGAVSVDGAHINRELQRFAALVAADHHEALESSKASDAESIAMYRRCRDDRDKHREAMRMALEALENSKPEQSGVGWVRKHNEAKRALRAALGEQE